MLLLLLSNLDFLQFTKYTKCAQIEAERKKLFGPFVWSGKLHQFVFGNPEETATQRFKDLSLGRHFLFFYPIILRPVNQLSKARRPKVGLLYCSKQSESITVTADRERDEMVTPW